MKIDTKYYGEIDYTKDELVVFPDGLFGFSQYHDYLPLSMEEDDSSLLILQSVDEPYVAFFLIDAAALFPSYSPLLLPVERIILSLDEPVNSSETWLCHREETRIHKVLIQISTSPGTSPPPP